MEEAETKAALMRVKRQNEGQLGFDLTQIPKFGIVLVLVVVLVLAALGFRDRKETDVLQLFCSVSLIAKRSGFSRTRHLSWSVNVFFGVINRRWRTVKRAVGGPADSAGGHRGCAVSSRQKGCGSI